MAGSTRNRSLIDQHPKLATVLIITSMLGCLLLGPTWIEFWIALVLLAIFAVGFMGRTQ
jgi:hypothetical protein